MTPQRHEQVKRLFLAACEFDEAGRTAFLDQACQGDRELRDQVESLLRHHQPETIIEEAVTAGAVRQALADEPSGTTTRAGTSEAPISPAAEDQPRFAAGTVIGQRYRIVGLLGRGGMGEVYRADDLKLNRPVALKFLAHNRTDDPAWLARFQNEVRLSLKVTHPHICRVYDIGEADGEVFISMEYVDGENLACLMRRIGRLPKEKAVQIVRQTCFGLAAAHGRGILHRDLKPENIMLDSRGDVRITDFGIAVLTEPATQGRTLIGTPAFMAPELLAGAPASVASDIFGLGALMYEVITGKRAFDADHFVYQTRRSPVTPPSRWVEDLDPAMERLVLQCIRDDPRERPASVYQVLAALPGTDPLTAALAAGEMPSPELVAAARTEMARPTLAIAGAVCALIGLLIIVMLAGRTFLLSRVGLTRAPAVLEDKAQEAILRLQGTRDSRDGVSGFFVDSQGLEWVRSGESPEQSTGQILAASHASPVHFEYQVSDLPSYPRGPLHRPRSARTASQLRPAGGATTVRLDPQGRLLAYSEVLDRPIPGNPRLEAPDWAAAFDLAGLRLSDFQAIPPVRQPPLFADVNMAWKEARPANAADPIRVEAAGLHDRVVFFEVVRPWEHGPGPDRIAETVIRTQIIASQARYFLFAFVVMGGFLLARHNLRLGRGDRRGAWRLTVFMLCLEAVQWVVRTRHSADLLIEAQSLISGLQYVVFAAVTAWCFYVAIEPFVRRLWPRSIISWSRLLIGRFRDPLIGRDLVIGTLIGVGIVLVQQLNVLLPPWFGRSRSLALLPHFGPELGALVGTPFKLEILVNSLQTAVWLGLALLLLMLLLRVVLRVPWIAGVAFLLTATILSALLFEAGTAVSWITHAIIALGIALMLVRVGLLAAIAGLFTTYLLTSVPMTSSFRSWYGGSAAFALLAVIALLAVGLYLSLPAPAHSRTAVPTS